MFRVISSQYRWVVGLGLTKLFEI